MKKTLKALVSLLLVCLMLFGSTSAALAAPIDGTAEQIKEGLFMSFSEFVEKQGVKGVFFYVPYITLLAPFLYVMSILGVGISVGLLQGIVDSVNK